MKTTSPSGFGSVLLDMPKGQCWGPSPKGSPLAWSPASNTKFCSVFRDDIIGSRQSSRTTFWMPRLLLEYLLCTSTSWYPSHALKLPACLWPSQGAWIPGTHYHTEQLLVDSPWDQDSEGQATKRIISGQLVSLGFKP